MTDRDHLPADDEFPLHPQEIEWARNTPEILRHLADGHEWKATEADAMDAPESCAWHEQRAKELNERADAKQKERER